MFTKVYEKIKQFIKENYKGLLLILFIGILFNYSLPYSIYTAGGMINMDERIESEDELFESSGSINSTYVSMIKGTLPMLALSKIIPSWDIVDNDDLTLDDEEIEETLKRDKYYMQEAISNATLVAYTKAGKDIIVKDSKSIVTYISEESITTLELYDEIKKYDDIKYTTFNDLREYISKKTIGETITFDIVRNGKYTQATAEIIEMDNESKVGLMSATINEYEINPQINVKTKSSESGPSGGLMTALAIYNAITETDITKGRIIAGTGTISDDGDIGEIGGVTYKIAGAEKQGADIFLCPKDNYEEAHSFTEKQGYDIIVVSVDTFDEAISFLERSE